MRTFVISDSHGHPEVFKAALEHGGFEPGRDRLVFAGDFLDRGTDAEGCLALVERYADEVLVGNHDLAVLLDIPIWPQEADSPSFRPLLIDRVLRADPSRAWKAATSVEGVLVSHAGISARYGRVFREVCGGDAAEFTRHLDEAFRDVVRWWVDGADEEEAAAAADPHADDESAAYETGGPLDVFGGDDGGLLLGEQGPFWFRPPPYTDLEPLAGVTQVAGHTPPIAGLARRGFHMIDPGVWVAELGEPLIFRYAVIEDGEVRVEEGDVD